MLTFLFMDVEQYRRRPRKIIMRIYNFLLRMQPVKLKQNPAKWRFKTPKVIFIGFHLSPKGVSPAPTLDKAISRVPKPAY